MEAKTISFTVKVLATYEPIQGRKAKAMAEIIASKINQKLCEEGGTKFNPRIISVPQNIEVRTISLD